MRGAGVRVEAARLDRRVPPEGAIGSNFESRSGGVDG